MNSVCLAQGSASMWAARGRIAREDSGHPQNAVIPVWPTDWSQACLSSRSYHGAVRLQRSGSGRASNTPPQ